MLRTGSFPASAWLSFFNTPQIYSPKDTVVHIGLHPVLLISNKKNTLILITTVMLIGQSDEGHSLIEVISCEVCQVANQDSPPLLA